MQTENETPNEQPNAPVENAENQENTVNETDAIADIVKRYNIEETAQEFRQQPNEHQQQSRNDRTEPNISSVPDVFDTEAMRSYLAQQAAGNSALQSHVQTLSATLTAMQMERINAQLDRDIKEAVTVVDEIAGTGKPKVIEAYLDGKVREDARLKAIWDNRGRNPKALQEALKVIGKEIATEFSVKTDPKLVEAQRARKAAQSSQATTREVSQDENIEAQIQQVGFDRFWESLKGDTN